VVERSTADRQVSSSNLDAPLIFWTSQVSFCKQKISYLSFFSEDQENMTIWFLFHSQNRITHRLWIKSEVKLVLHKCWIRNKESAHWSAWLTCRERFSWRNESIPIGEWTRYAKSWTAPAKPAKSWTAPILLVHRSGDGDDTKKFQANSQKSFFDSENARFMIRIQVSLKDLTRTGWPCEAIECLFVALIILSISQLLEKKSQDGTHVLTDFLHFEKNEFHSYWNNEKNEFHSYWNNEKPLT
jgi:hypothetical protein